MSTSYVLFADLKAARCLNTTDIHLLRRNDVERLLECYNDVLRRKHQEIIKICCNIEKLLEFQVEAELQTEFELLQIGKKQEGNYSKLKVNYLTLKSLIFKRSKIWILCLNSNALGSHITLIFIRIKHTNPARSTEIPLNCLYSGERKQRVNYCSNNFFRAIVPKKNIFRADLSVI
ncbi:hypothetical protein YC2023_009947 [Brassica napus]